jgi:hypothetical protein
MYRAESIDAPSAGQLSADSVRVRPTLLGIGSAFPPFEVTMLAFGASLTIEGAVLRF